MKMADRRIAWFSSPGGSLEGRAIAYSFLVVSTGVILLTLPRRGRAIAYGTISPRVVPADAGTHHPGSRSLRKVSTPMLKRDDTAYGSRRSPGRLVEGIGVRQPNHPDGNCQKGICDCPAALQGKGKKELVRRVYMRAYARTAVNPGSAANPALLA